MNYSNLLHFIHIKDIAHQTKHVPISREKVFQFFDTHMPAKDQKEINLQYLTKRTINYHYKFGKNNPGNALD